MAISFVAAGTAFSRIGSGTSFTLNAPAGVTNGDRMIAMVACFANGSQKTVTLPSGWTLVKDVYYNNTDQIQLTVMTRQYATGDPASWSGSYSSSVLLCTADVAAYRNVQALGASGTATAAAVTSFSTATINNTTANSWRVVCGAYVSLTTNYTINSNETTRRALFAADDSGGSGATQAAIWDSDTTSVATGNTSRTVSRSASWSVAASVILMLQPTTGTPASGTFAQPLGGVTMAAAGTVVDNATLAMPLSGVSMDFPGYGQPPVASGTLAQPLSPVVMDLAGATEPRGTLDMAILPNVEFSTETRVFGNRVITVEADDRTIVVPSRGVDG